MKLWDEIVTAALLGTERTPAPQFAASGALSNLLAGLPHDSPEARLLGAAAVLGVYTRAGWKPQADPQEPDVFTGEEAQPVCSPGAERLLQRVLHSPEFQKIHRNQLFGEWVMLATQAGRLISPPYLAGLVEDSATDESKRALFAPLLGRRGAWLARQNPEWANAAAVEENGEKVWNEGTLAARVAYLHGLRTRDAAAAQALLAAGWKREPANARLTLMETLDEGLSLDDEPFLEAALDDRSKSVRLAAAGLLSRLPASRFAVRMAARADQCVKVEKKLLGGRKMIVELPGELDDAARRDALDEGIAALEEKTGRKGSLLRQIISLTPLDAWTHRSELVPEELIRLARKTEWAHVIISGWSTAAVKQRHEDWMWTLLNDGGAEIARYYLHQFLDGLSENRVFAYIRRIMAAKAGPRLTEAAATMGERDLMPDADLTRSILNLLRTEAASAFDASYPRFDLIMQIALRGAPECFTQAREIVTHIMTAHPASAARAQEFLSLYEFRCAMHKEFNP